VQSSVEAHPRSNHMYACVIIASFLDTNYYLRLPHFPLIMFSLFIFCFFLPTTHLNSSLLFVILQDVAGSPYWIAPEIIEMATPSTACDIWCVTPSPLSFQPYLLSLFLLLLILFPSAFLSFRSVGCTIIELLTGHPPYYNMPPVAALFSIVQVGLALPCLALPCLALPCLALHCRALPCVALPCLTLHCLALPCLALSCLALPCLALPCLALPCLALPCLALPCLALPCLALPCLALPCHALPCLALPFPLLFLLVLHSSFSRSLYILFSIFQ
jgi:hypothetical protein